MNEGGDGLTPISVYTEDTLVQQTTAEYLEQQRYAQLQLPTIRRLYIDN